MATRISTAQMFHNAQSQIAGAREKEVISAEKSSTMKEISRPSQDPGGWVKASNLKDDLSIKESISKNAALAMHTLAVTDNALMTIQESLQKAHEVALASAGTDTMSAASREHALTEVKNLYDSTIQTLNTRYANRTLLAGLKSQGLAFDRAGNYLGDSENFEIDIDRNLRVPINITGDRVILGAGKEGGINLLASFHRLIEGMQSHDVELVRSTIEDFGRGDDHLSEMRSEVAGRMNQIDKRLAANAISAVDSKEAISKIEEADVIKVFSELARDQAVLRAAMSTSQKLLSEYPADILFK